MNYSLPNIKIKSTRDALSKDTRLAQMIWAPTGFGKTKLAASLHHLTMKHFGKPTLLIAVESGEGGGTATLRDLDIPIYIPKDFNELDSTLSALKGDKQFGGIILDSATEMVKSYIKPVALSYPAREKSPTVMLPRTAGIPTQSDYGPMGELCRMVFQKLLNISANPDPSLKKHIIVTALKKSKENSEGQTIWIGPSLPGAMAEEGAGMFQIASTIEIKPSLVNGKRELRRFLVTDGDGVRSLKDRFRVLPKEIPLKNADGGGDGMDLCDMWEKFWMPEIQKRSEEVPNVETE